MSYEMPLQEAIDRIDRIKSYRDYHAKAGQPQHALSQDEVDKLVISWGHDPELAKGVGRVPSKPQQPKKEVAHGL